MNESIGGFQSNMRISYKWAVLALVILGMMLIAISDLPRSIFSRSEYQYLAIFSYVSAGLVFVSDWWKPWLGKFLLIVLTVSLIVLGNFWLDVPGLLSLLIIPVIMAAAFMGLRIAIVTAIGETAGLLALNILAEMMPGEITIALFAIWSVLILMFTIYGPMYEVIDWVWDFYRRTQIALDDAQKRKERLAQVLEDLTRANRQMVLANEKMKYLRQLAENARKNKTEFVSKVSHEFRTPLNIIIGMVNLMVNKPEMYEGDFPSGVHRQLEIVNRNCQHLANMINDVLDLSQTEAGLMTINRQPTNLKELIESAYKVVRPLLDEKNLSWQLSVPDDLLEINCDRTRIRQVILNLLSNAARFTSNGGVSLGVNLGTDHILVSVADSGPGISPEDAENIFTPFSQSSRVSDQSGGSGLGLSISKQFIELHDGKMWLESELGVGTTFFFELPIGHPIDPFDKAGHWIREDWEWRKPQSLVELPEAHFKPRMVIYDETADIYASLIRTSDEIEFVPTQDLSGAILGMKETPAQALIINASSHDVLLSSINQARDRLHNTPIIGTSFPFKMQQVFEAGAVDYLAKPISLEDLTSAIQKLDVDLQRVLIVDDTPDIRELLSFYLRAIDEKIDVIAIENGEQALEEIPSIRPDLILLDIVMPELNGWEVLEMIKGDPANKDIPVILVSAQDLSMGHTSDIFIATMGEGISMMKMLDCSRDFVSRMLLTAEALD